MVVVVVAAAAGEPEAPCSCDRGSCNIEYCIVPPVNYHHCCCHPLHRSYYCGSLLFQDRRYESADIRCTPDADNWRWINPPNEPVVFGSSGKLEKKYHVSCSRKQDKRIE